MASVGGPRRRQLRTAVRHLVVVCALLLCPMVANASNSSGPSNIYSAALEPFANVSTFRVAIDDLLNVSANTTQILDEKIGVLNTTSGVFSSNATCVIGGGAATETICVLNVTFQFVGSSMSIADSALRNLNVTAAKDIGILYLTFDSSSAQVTSTTPSTTTAPPTTTSTTAPSTTTTLPPSTGSPPTVTAFPTATTTSAPLPSSTWVPESNQASMTQKEIALAIGIPSAIGAILLIAGGCCLLKRCADRANAHASAQARNHPLPNTEMSNVPQGPPLHPSASWKPSPNSPQTSTLSSPYRSGGALTAASSFGNMPPPTSGATSQPQYAQWQQQQQWPTPQHQQHAPQQQWSTPQYQQHAPQQQWSTPQYQQHAQQQQYPVQQEWQRHTQQPVGQPAYQQGWAPNGLAPTVSSPSSALGQYNQALPPLQGYNRVPSPAMHPGPQPGVAHQDLRRGMGYSAPPQGPRFADWQQGQPPPQQRITSWSAN